ncbi:MAG: hypothetical protein MUC95_06180, partial [Spirochaetes bacterium]|nr:hypothetical protein [Spirochaetota bacterium]
MAGSTKYAPAICIILSVLALVGIIVGIEKNSPLVTICALMPAVIYEVYRTEGMSTRAASWGLLVIFIIEIVLIAARININLSSIFGIKKQIIGGYRVPLGDVKTMGPVIMAILSIILFIRTNGIYTKWL